LALRARSQWAMGANSLNTAPMFRLLVNCIIFHCLIVKLDPSFLMDLHSGSLLGYEWREGQERATALTDAVHSRGGFSGDRVFCFGSLIWLLSIRWPQAEAFR